MAHGLALPVQTRYIGIRGAIANHPARATGPCALDRPASSVKVPHMTDNSSLNRPAPATLDLLLSRRSGSAKAMTGPGPDPGRVAHDPGRRRPGARPRQAGALALHRDRGRGPRPHGRGAGQSPAGDRSRTRARGRIELERGRFLRAPVVVAVVSRVRKRHPDPRLGAGIVGRRVLPDHADRGRTRMGYVGNWITEWCAYRSTR